MIHLAPSQVAGLNENWKKIIEIYESENSRHNITVIDWIDRNVVLKTFGFCWGFRWSFCLYISKGRFWKMIQAEQKIWILASDGGFVMFNLVTVWCLRIIGYFSCRIQSVKSFIYTVKDTINHVESSQEIVKSQCLKLRFCPSSNCLCSTLFIQ